MLEFDHVGKTYRTGLEVHTALRSVSFSVDRAQRVGIIGESGSGKSTLVRLALGLDQPTSGEVRFEGQVVARHNATLMAEYRRAVQWIGQDTGGAFNPRWTIRRTLRRVNACLCGWDTAEADRRSAELCELMGLDPALLDRRPGALSGGQRQRFSIVRAVLPRPRLLLADEAVSALDVSAQGMVLNLLRDYCDSADCALMFVSHGLPATAFMTSTVNVMRSGEVVEAGPTAQILTAPQHEYTRSLVAAYRY